MPERQQQSRTLTSEFRSQMTVKDVVLGERIYREGRVGELRESSSSFWAEVRGDQGRPYRVLLQPNSRTIDCSCPRFVRHGGCKHAWAVLLRFESEQADRLDRRWERALDVLADGERLLAATPPLLVTYGIHLDSVMAQEIDLRVHVQKRGAKGEYGRPRVARPDDRDFLSPEDQAIVPLLEGARRVGWRAASHGYFHQYDTNRALHLDLGGAGLSGLVERLVATGRFFLFRGDRALEPALGIAADSGWRPVLRLSEGRPRVIELEFRAGDRTIPAAAVDLLLPPGWFLVGHEFHRLAEGLDCRWLDRLDPRDLVVPAEATDLFYEKALATSLAPFLELDDSWEVVDADAARIRPVLQIVGGLQDAREVDLVFDYDGIRATRPGPTIGDGRNRRVIRRVQKVERQYFARAAEVLGVDPRAPGRLGLPVGSLFEPLDTLAREGFAVEIAGAPLRRPQAVRARVTSGTDWFDLEGGVDFGNEVLTYPEILEGLKSGAGFVVLSDGSHGILPEEWRRRLPLLAAAEVEDGRLRFKRNQGLLLDLLLEAAPKPKLDAAFRKLSRGLDGFRGIAEKKEPRAFQGELRPYQRKGLGWLEFLREVGLGGCLADDMGLGKTVQILAFLQQRKGKKDAGRPFLVVAPKSVTSNWLDEAARFTPGIPRIDYGGGNRREILAELPPSAIVVTTYGLLRRDIEALREVEFDTVILDESQAIKNASSQTAKAARLLNAHNRLALTGTPIENRIEELWSLFEFLNPGMFPSMRVLHELGSGDAEDRKRLGRLISPFLLRRKKEEVAVELPPRIEQSIVCELTGKQRRYYDDVLRFQRLSINRKLQSEGLERSKLHVLEALLRLRQIACHPGLVNDDYRDTHSSKIDALLEHLEEVVAEGHKALVFSQFTGLLAIVRTALDRQGTTYEYLDGSTRDRAERIARFQSDANCPVFLISLKAGGTGLNLTAADYVFILDPWWNPAVEAQAIDRSHRIGQTRQVVAYRLIAKDTIEEKIVALQHQKRELADSILEGNAKTLRDLSREDIEALFA